MKDAKKESLKVESCVSSQKPIIWVRSLTHFKVLVPSDHRRFVNNPGADSLSVVSASVKKPA